MQSFSKLTVEQQIAALKGLHLYVGEMKVEDGCELDGSGRAWVQTDVGLSHRTRPAGAAAVAPAAAATATAAAATATATAAAAAAIAAVASAAAGAAIAAAAKAMLIF